MYLVDNLKTLQKELKDTFKEQSFEDFYEVSMSESDKRTFLMLEDLNDLLVSTLGIFRKNQKHKIYQVKEEYREPLSYLLRSTIILRRLIYAKYRNDIVPYHPTTSPYEYYQKVLRKTVFLLEKLYQDLHFGNTIVPFNTYAITQNFIFKKIHTNSSMWFFKHVYKYINPCRYHNIQRITGFLSCLEELIDDVRCITGDHVLSSIAAIHSEHPFDEMSGYKNPDQVYPALHRLAQYFVMISHK